LHPTLNLEHARRSEVSLHYLASYERMGRVRVQCLGSCMCDAHTIDAHRPESRDSTWEQRTIEVMQASRAGRCILQVFLLGDSSLAERTRFSLRMLQVRRLTEKASSMTRKTSHKRGGAWQTLTAHATPVELSQLL
jgi:hypothetical protein